MSRNDACALFGDGTNLDRLLDEWSDIFQTEAQKLLSVSGVNRDALANSGGMPDSFTGQSDVEILFVSEELASGPDDLSEPSLVAEPSTVSSQGCDVQPGTTTTTEVGAKVTFERCLDGKVRPVRCQCKNGLTIEYRYGVGDQPTIIGSKGGKNVFSAKPRSGGGWELTSGTNSKPLAFEQLTLFADGTFKVSNKNQLFRSLADGELITEAADAGRLRVTADGATVLSERGQDGNYRPLRVSHPGAAH
ncbi:MAG: hypothetical protein K2Z81_01545, partial [Cyanobacteria bacterium]|nr:hypothetical protein [Cyanobacteriota bacterium]